MDSHIKTLHGQFSIDHVKSFKNLDEFLEAGKDMLSRLDKKEREAFLRNLYSEINPEIKKAAKKEA